MKHLGLIITLLLTGCVTVNDNYGSGPIELAPRIVAMLEKYKALKNPSFFAVSTDGQSGGYSYCKVKDCAGDWEFEINLAKLSCENKSYGVPCRIYS